MNDYSSIKYLIEDYPKTLFPLSTTKVIVENMGKTILEEIKKKSENNSFSFLPQTRCYASKQGFHLRRTVKLDPLAELFIYDIIYRNRKCFRKAHNKDRCSYGYGFENGKPRSQSESYEHFKKHIAYAKIHDKFVLKLDVANYFNSLYHHDIINWFQSIDASEQDVTYLSRFLRQTNSGISIDCLPQGIHPCKVIGSEFLKFIDNNKQLECSRMIRFMDDFYLFANEKNILINDFLTIQKLLGQKGLSLNSSKTILGEVCELNVIVDEIKSSLLKSRREAYENNEFKENEDQKKLNPEQVDYLLNLLKKVDINESDTELVLKLLPDHETKVLNRMNIFFQRFPSLSKNIYHFSKDVKDKDSLASLILNFIKTGENITEDQLFWMAKITEDRLQGTSHYSDILFKLYKHQNATIISRAKVLEIPETKYGMQELREEQLRNGQSNWLTWSAAVGHRSVGKMSRNNILKYASNCSEINKIICDCIKQLP